MTTRMTWIGWICLTSIPVTAQGHGHRVPSVDYMIGGVNATFHARFVGDGTQPAEVVVLEYQPASSSDDTVGSAFLPGAVPGLPCSVGGNEWLVLEPA